MKHAIGYARVSSTKQGRSGFGLRSQEAAIRGMASALNLGILKIYEEVESAIQTGADGRERLQEAIEAARRHQCPLIVASWDRVSRDALEIERLHKECGVTIIDAEIGPHATDAVIKARSARVSEETRMLRERTREGMRRAKQRGEVFGNRRNLAEAQSKGAAATRRKTESRDRAITDIILRCREMPLSQVADVLNRGGHRTATGKPWSKDRLRRVRRRIESARSPHRQTDPQRREDNWGLF